MRWGACRGRRSAIGSASGPGWRWPRAALVVAGDFNVNLGGKHYYGTERARKALRAGLAERQLHCATEWAQVPEGMLQFSPIDHVVVPSSWAVRTKVVRAWEGTDADGVKLSDHSGLVVEVGAEPTK